MSYSHRIWVYGPVGLLLLLALLYSVFWRVEADMLAAQLDRANGGEVLPGIVFAFAEKTIGGFPFRFDVVLSGVTVAQRSAEGETAWRTENLAIHALTYGQPLYILEAAGLQSFALPGGAGQTPRVTYVTPAQARASAIFRQGRLVRFDADILGADGKDATQGADIARTFSAGRAQLHLLRQPAGAIDVAMRIDNAQIGEGYHPLLGTAFSLIDLRGRLMSGGELDGLLAGKQDAFSALEQWRKSGGLFDVQTLQLEGEAIKTELKGTLALDASHRPEGSLSGKIDARELVSRLTGGRLNLNPTTDNAAELSLRFQDGDITVSNGSALPAR